MGEFILFVDDQLVGHFDNLVDAQQKGEEHIGSKSNLRIESLVEPAPSQTWRFDYDVKSWVRSD